MNRPGALKTASLPILVSVEITSGVHALEFWVLVHGRLAGVKPALLDTQSRSSLQDQAGCSRHWRPYLSERLSGLTQVVRKPGMQVTYDSCV